MSMQTKKVVWGGFWLALGLLMPQILHMVGGPGLGSMLLPMHIPVFLAGLTLGPFFGLILGLLTPILSHLLTGMPPAAPPIVVLMFFELGIYGFVSGLLYVKRKRGLILTIILSMIAGRIGLGLAAAFVTPMFGFGPPVLAYLQGAVLGGLPGIIFQVVLIPVILKGGNFSARLGTGKKGI